MTNESDDIRYVLSQDDENIFVLLINHRHDFIKYNESYGKQSREIYTFNEY